MLKPIRARLSKFLGGNFVRSVGVLVGGTAFAQALMVLILPILTRLYSPADFATLAVYASLLSLFAAIACLRFEIAIPIPESEEDAVNLLVLALASSATLGAFIGLVVWVCPDRLIALTGQSAFRPYLWLFPLGVWLSGSYAALQYWSTRHKNFKLIARTRLGQATSSAAVQLGFGWAGLAPFGLLFGQLISSGAGVFRLAVDLWRRHRDALALVRMRTMVRTFRRYDRFPKYSTLEALANGANIQLPILIIAALAAGPEAGFLMLATRIMAAPMTLVGGAISQVFLANAPEEKRAGRLESLTSKVLAGLIKTGAGPLVCIGIVSPYAFPVIFGVEWTRAGEIVSWMLPWLVLQLLSSPVSMLLHVMEKQRSAFFLQVAGLLIRVGFVAFAAVWLPLLAVAFYAISGGFFYLIYLVVVLNAAGIRPIVLARLTVSAWKVLLAWLLISIALSYLFVIIQSSWDAMRFSSM